MTIKDLGIKALRTIKKYSPEILLATGIGSGIAAGYFTYKKSENVHQYLDNMERLMEEEGYEPTKKELVIDISKELAIPIVLTIGSITAVVASYKIQNNRILGLSAALTATTAEYTRFQNRTKEIVGEKKYEEISHPVVKETVTNEEGKEVETTTPVETLFDGVWWKNSEFAVSDDFDYNMQYVESLKAQLELTQFNKNGLVLNEVLETLGMDKSRQGALLGWMGANFGMEPELVFVTDEYGKKQREIYIRWDHKPTYIYDKVNYDSPYFFS